jgi:hypothetical protein
LDVGVRRVHKRINNSRLAGLRLVYGCGPLVSCLTVELSVGGSRGVHFTRNAVDGDSRASQALEPPTIDDQGLATQPVALRIANSINFRVNSNAPTIRAGEVAMFGGLKESDISSSGEVNVWVHAFGGLIGPNNGCDRPDLPL